MARKTGRVSEITVIQGDPAADEVGLRRILDLNAEVGRRRVALNEARKALHHAQADLHAYITGLSKDMPLFERA